MSTEYVPLKPILADDFWRDIESLGYWEVGLEEDDPGLGWVTDGTNAIHVHYCSSTESVTFTRYGANDVEAMLDAVGAHFGTEIIGEFDDRYEEVFDRYYARDYLTGSDED